MEFRPLQNRVLVRRTDPANMKKEPGTYLSAGGIHLLEETVTSDQCPQGLVVSVGPGKYNKQGFFVSTDVKVGDTVLFGKHVGTEIKLNGESLLVMTDEEILGVVKPVTQPLAVKSEV